MLKVEQEGRFMTTFPCNPLSLMALKCCSDVQVVRLGPNPLA